ncbi:MAG: hypothetical protein IPP71_20170 [Bacteroidetes bacterium]|nr:hypothetical protein [Bacteroidota bacterium]
MIQNKNSGNILIPELKNFDFLFLLNGEEDYFEQKNFTDLLAKFRCAIRYSVDVNLLKSNANLLIRHFNEQYKRKLR